MTMKIHFTSSNSKEALSLKSKYCELYNQANLREADVIVAIGGDGEMLKALRLAIKNNSSVFGLNKGHIGFLMNKINKTNLIKRINKASQLTVHPLEMECFDHKGKKQTFLGINEISLFRNTNQSSIISISVDGVERLRDLSEAFEHLEVSDLLEITCASIAIRLINSKNLDDVKSLGII